jgi:hypothetical protein
VLGLILLSVGVLAWASSYYIAHLVHDKVSLLRATDAAALSAATVQARHLNLHAYLNRAQLANQLAMIHLIALASQERFRSTQARQSLSMNPPAFVIGMFFGPSYAASYLAAQAGGISDRFALQTLESAFQRHDQVIKDTIEQTRRALLRDMTAARNQTLEKVLIRNAGESGSSIRGNTLSELGLNLVILRDELKQGVSYFSTQTPVWESVFKKVTEPYDFLKPRNASRHNIWAVNVRCPHKRHALRRRGQTTANVNGRFESSDTLSFHAIRSNRVIGCYEREYPMGWAKIDSSAQGQSLLHQAQISNDENAMTVGTQNFSSQPFWQWVKKQGIPGWDIFNGRDNQLAESWSDSQTIRWQSKAKPGFTEVSASRPSFRFDIDTTQTLRFLSQQRNKTDFSGRFNLVESKPDAMSTDVLRAQSSSLTYFARPEVRHDGKEEQPNLFHPYWHARLVSR